MGVVLFQGDNGSWMATNTACSMTVPSVKWESAPVTFDELNLPPYFPHGPAWYLMTCTSYQTYRVSLLLLIIVRMAAQSEEGYSQVMASSPSTEKGLMWGLGDNL